MTSSVRSVVVLGTLAGFLGTVGPGAAVALHVVLEHEATHLASGHAHDPGHGLADGEGHPHESHFDVPDHEGARILGEGLPAHRHALSLAGDLPPRASRSLAELSTGPAAIPRVPMTPAARPPPLATQRAGPPFAPSPPSSRLVVLRI